jgi:dihydropteroate synthase-like protein
VERERILFVTGRLAESALRRVVDSLNQQGRCDGRIAVLPISVAALLTADWVGRHLTVSGDVNRVVLPGFCRGDLEPLRSRLGVECVLGPKDLADLPEYLGGGRQPVDLSAFNIEIIAEINHAPRIGMTALCEAAKRYRLSGADVIDIGCDPGGPWSGIGDAVRRLRDEGYRVSVDSFDPVEIAEATRAGAELVLSVNASNRDAADDWGVEVVAIPDEIENLGGLEDTLNHLDKRGVRFRIDPILEPIGCGFAKSLGRYLTTRQRYPNAAMMMGVGNLTELTDVDSAGINMLLAGFCEEIGIHSVLTTEVINWARSSVRELDIARRLAFRSASRGVPPKRLSSDLVILRDVRIARLGQETLNELAARVTDPNYRIFAESDEIHVFNSLGYHRGADPFALFEAICRMDARMTPDHAFYLGYEMAKAITALTLGKTYAQDQALDWGFLTRPEAPHHSPDDEKSV